MRCVSPSRRTSASVCGERMCPRELGIAIRADDEQPRALRLAQQVAQQRQRRLARPVEVVEDEQDRRLGRCRAKQLGDGVEQREPLGVGIGAYRRRASASTSPSSGTNRRSSSTPRTVRSRAAPSAGTNVRTASMNGCSGAARSSSQRPYSTSAPAACVPARDLAREPRFPDAGFAADERRAQRCVDRAIPQIGELRELVAAADERTGTRRARRGPAVARDR